MDNLNEVEKLFVIGVIKELYKRGIITEKEMFTAIKKVTEKPKEGGKNK